MAVNLLNRISEEFAISKEISLSVFGLAAFIVIFCCSSNTHF